MVGVPNQNAPPEWQRAARLSTAVGHAPMACMICEYLSQMQQYLLYMLPKLNTYAPDRNVAPAAHSRCPGFGVFSGGSKKPPACESRKQAFESRKQAFFGAWASRPHVSFTDARPDSRARYMNRQATWQGGAHLNLAGF